MHRIPGRLAGDYREPFPFQWPARAVALLLTGYLFFDKAFAYIHIPGTVVYIGELVVLVVGLYLVWSRPTIAVTRSAPGALLLLFVLFSLARTVPYVATFGFDAVRDASIWYYAVFAVFAMVAMERLGVEKIVEWYGRMQFPFVVWAPFAVLLAATMTYPLVPDSRISVFDHSLANTSVMLSAATVYFWLVARPSDVPAILRRAVATGIAALVIVFSGIANRGGFVAVVLGLGIATLLARAPSHRRFVSIMAITLTTVVAVSLVLDLRMDVFSNDREVSVRQLVENLVSITGQGSGVVQEGLEGTSSWRLSFWEAIIEDVSSSHFLLGLGYGENIAERYGYVGWAEGFRSAHNSHMTIFGRSGFIGAVLWVGLWWTWFYGLLRARRGFLARGADLQADVCSWLVVVAVVMLVNSVFDPTFESPQVAAWIWSIFGVGVALISSVRSPKAVPRESGQSWSRYPFKSS